MFPKLFILYISLVYTAKRSYQSVDQKISLQDLQEKILLDQRNQECSSPNFNFKSIKYIPPQELLRDMELMNETAFIILWSSFGNYRYTWSKVNLFKELNEERFEIMKGNYELYLGEVVLGMLLSANPEDSKDVKEGLLFQAISLYQGRFRSIWMRIAGKTKKFDDLKEAFLIYQRVIDLGIYNVLEYLFKKIVKHLEMEPNNYDLIYFYKVHFHNFLSFLTVDEKENFGLKWVAEKTDPYLILAYFAYQDSRPGHHNTFIWEIKCRKIDPWWNFNIAFRLLRKKAKDQFDLINGVLKFNNDFKSPFPLIINDNELVSIIRKIISKLISFCNNHNKGIK
jgi:hypothetical protein